MPEEPFADRLKRLEDRIAAARAGRAEPQRGHRGEFTQGSLAWRMVIELVVGMLLGLGIGWGLDALFGTRPVFLVVFALLGFAAGVRTMLRTAEEVRQKRGEAALMRGGWGRSGPERSWRGVRAMAEEAAAAGSTSTRWTSSRSGRCSAARPCTGTRRPTPRSGWRWW